MYDQLWPNQKPAADFVLRTKTAGLFAEQGTGKTWITAAVTEQLLDDDFNAMFVVPLTNLETTWETMFDRFPFSTGITVARDWETYKKARCPKILLIHYEGMSVNRLDKKITKHPWKLVVFDESQKIKSRGSRQSRIAGRIKNADRRIILSGTPFDDLTDDPQEIWAQMRFLNPDVFGRRWRDYEDDYLRRSGYMGYKRAFRKGKLAEVLAEVEPYVLRLELEDVVKLPPISYIDKPVLLLGQQSRMYQEMERDMVTSFSDSTISSELAITQLVKLQQICGGFIKDDEEEIHGIGRAKLRKLKSIVKRNDFPLVIFAKYSYEVAQIASELSGGNVRISTIEGKNRKTRTQTIRDFQNGKIDILVAQVKTGGVGIDLQTACVAIFYSTTFSFIDFEQAVARLHRAGQTRPVKIYLLYAKNTVDKLIFEAILLKRSVSETVLSTFRKGNPQSRRPIMAKKTSKAKDKTEKKEKKPDMKYGINELSDALGIAPTSARVKLRKHKIEKVGGRYGWNTKAEMNEVIDIISAKPEKDEEDD